MKRKMNCCDLYYLVEHIFIEETIKIIDEETEINLNCFAWMFYVKKERIIKERCS